MTPTERTQYEVDRDEYEKTIREIGWDEDCIFAALNGFNYASSLIEKKDREIAELKHQKCDQIDQKHWNGIEASEKIEEMRNRLTLHTDAEYLALEQQLKSCEEMIGKMEEALKVIEDKETIYTEGCECDEVAISALASLTEWRKKNGG